MSLALRRAWSAWEAFLFEDVRQEPLALGRVLLGVTMFLTWAVVRRDLDAIWGPGGLAAHVGDERWLHGLLPHRAVRLAVLLASVSLALGFLTRVSCGVVLLGHLYFVHQVDQFSWASVRVSTTFLAYFLLSRCGSLASFDAYLARRAGRPASTLAPAWPTRLVQVHACVLHAAAALPRLWNPSWWRGEKAFEATVFSIWGRFPNVDWMPWKPLLEALTYATWILELAAPVLLCWRRTRTATAVALVGLHVGMEASTDTAWWQWLCVAALLTFLPADLSAGILRFLSMPFAWAARRLGRG